MIQLLFALVLAEMALMVVVVFRTPMRKAVMMGIDRFKHSRGLIVVETVAVIVFVAMTATVYSVMAIQGRMVRDGDADHTDQILLAKRLLEASLMGFSLFLVLIIDRLHHYTRELRMTRKSIQIVKQQNRLFEKTKDLEEQKMKSLKEQSNELHERIKQLESQIDEKAKNARSAEASRVALKKQAEGFHLEYDRLDEENRKLRKQLQSLDRKISYSDYKKVS